jgi:NAD(P)-dependent dehydrogenase (short-subunit alcohol dehydrogenase family)
MTTWCIVGASRGIGFEFVRQLLDRGDQVIAAVRDPYKASELWRLAASQTTPGACQLCECDVTSEASINVGCQSSLILVKC